MPTVRNRQKQTVDIASMTLYLKAMAQERPESLIKTAKHFWREFAPAWGFPFVFLYGFLASDRLGYPFLFFCLVAVPLFFWSGNRASRPYFQKKARYWHVAFWGQLIPFILWAFAVFSRLYVLRLLDEA